MKDKDKIGLVAQIISGYTFIKYRGKQYIIDTPDDKLINESINVYNQTLRLVRFEEFLLNDDVEFVLIKNKLWKINDAANLVELQKSLDNCKIELYSLFKMPQSQISKVRSQIELIRKSQGQKLYYRNYLEQYTTEGYAEKIAELYLFSNLLLDENYNPITVSDFDLDNIIHNFKNHLPTVSKLREIARTEPWRSTWATDKNCFRKVGDEQKMLVMFTKMYENVWEHSERPPDVVIEDDDMLDGWFLTMRRKSEQERQESTKNQLEKKYSKAGEIVVFSNTPQEIQEIGEMNDARGKIISKKIHSMVAQKGYAKHLDIPEYRLEAQNG